MTSVNGTVASLSPGEGRTGLQTIVLHPGPAASAEQLGAALGSGAASAARSKKKQLGGPLQQQQLEQQQQQQQQ